MALSNMKREPQREITESVVGILTLVGFLYGAYRYGRFWVALMDPSNPSTDPWILDLLIGALFLSITLVLLILLSVVFVRGTHALGDAVCNLLAIMNLDPRPKERYGTTWAERREHARRVKV